MRVSVGVHQELHSPFHSLLLLTLADHIENLREHLLHAFFSQVHDSSHKALLVLSVINVHKTAILAFFSMREHNYVVFIIVVGVMVSRDDSVNNNCIDNSVNEMFIFVDCRHFVGFGVVFINLLLVFNEGSLGLFKDALLFTGDSLLFFAVGLTNACLLVRNLLLAALLAPTLSLFWLEFVYSLMASLATNDQESGSFNFCNADTSLVPRRLPSNRVYNLDTVVAQLVRDVCKLAEVNHATFARALVSYDLYTTASLHLCFLGLSLVVSLLFSSVVFG